jgi:hypothetical protein
VKYKITVSEWSNTEPQRHFIGELHRDHLLCASCYGPSEADVREKCLAVQRIDEGKPLEAPAIKDDDAKWEASKAAFKAQSRRDRFIAAALTSVLHDIGDYPNQEQTQFCAKLSVQLADAVMAEADRAAKPQEGGET